VKDFEHLFENKNQFIYVVAEGETLKSICEKFYLSENIVICDNYLTSEICKGQHLFIRKSKCVHVVKVGETIGDICEKYGVLESEIMALNNVDYIYAGLKLTIKFKE
jgi:LysM repeat protein